MLLCLMSYNSVMLLKHIYLPTNVGRHSNERSLEYGWTQTDCHRWCRRAVYLEMHNAVVMP